LQPRSTSKARPRPMSRGNLCARNKPNRHLWLAEDRFANGSKTHVHGQRDLTPSTPGPSLDLAIVTLGMFLNRSPIVCGN